MLLRLAPLIFVIIWSGAFVAARGGLPDFTPWAILALRFVAAAFLLAGLALFIREKDPDWKLFRKSWAGIVGAGITGLTAAFRLQTQNIPVTIYEASTQVGNLPK